MNDNIHLCMGCMRPISRTAVICPHCAYNSKTVQQSPFLPTQTILLGRYIIGKALYTSPSGAQYIGFDVLENRAVKIHEFLPEKFISRPTNAVEITVKEEYEHLYYECLGSFESLWRTLQSFNGYPVIDTVYDVFYLNNTAYAVCEFISCVTLSEFFCERRKLLPWNRACAAFKPIISSLADLHRIGFVHAELSSETILVAPDGKLRLSGFSIFQSHGGIPELSSPPADGYAPIERYNDCSHLFSGSDVYSLAALMFTALTGLKAPDAQKRVIEDSFTIPKQIENKMPACAAEAMYFALQIFPSARMRTADELLKALVPLNAPREKNEPAPILKTDPNIYKEKTEESNRQKQESVKQEKREISEVGIIFKSFFCAIIIIAMIFATLYTTFLYNYIDLPFLDNALSSFNFLPMNLESAAAEPETETASDESNAAAISVETATVADFKKLSYDSIKQNEVFNRNFDLVYEFEYSDTYEKNEIISQSIPAGQSVNIGASITLVVSRGKPIVVLKDVVGMDFAQAYNQLTSDGFKVNKEVTENDGTHKENEVYEMSLVSGLKFEKGSEITLRVWGAPKN